MAPPSPYFLFQYVVGDYFSLAGVNYLILGDRFSGWLSIYTAGAGEFDAKGLVKKTRDYFTDFNIPEEIATDVGPQMTSSLFQQSLKAWGVYPLMNSSSKLCIELLRTYWSFFVYFVTGCQCQHNRGQLVLLCK